MFDCFRVNRTMYNISKRCPGPIKIEEQLHSCRGSPSDQRFVHEIIHSDLVNFVLYAKIIIIRLFKHDVRNLSEDYTMY